MACSKCGNEVRLIALTYRDVLMPREAGKDCSYNPFAFPPSMAVRCTGAAITEPDNVVQILEHLDLPATPPPLAPARGPPLGDVAHTPSST